MPLSKETKPKPSDGEASILELWGVWSTSSLLLVQDPFWQIEMIYYLMYTWNYLNISKLMTDIKLNYLYYIEILEGV